MREFICGWGLGEKLAGDVNGDGVIDTGDGAHDIRIEFVHARGIGGSFVAQF